MLIQTQYSRKPSRKSTPIYASNGQVIGYVINRTFRKNISGSKHFLKIPPGIAFDVSALDQAAKAGAEWVEVFDRESSIVYRASIESFRQKGITVNRKWGEQIGLTFTFWTILDPSEPKQSKLFA